MAFAEFAPKLFDQGWITPIPLRGKVPLIEGWNLLRDREQTRDEIESLAQLFPTSETGLVVSRPIVWIDADVKNLQRAKEIEEILFGVVGRSPLRRYGDEPKVLVGYRCDEPLLLPRFRFDGTTVYVSPKGEQKKENLQIFQESGQVVLFGIHPETNHPYRWPDKSPLDLSPDSDEIPLLTREACIQFLSDALPIIGAEYRGHEIAGNSADPRPGEDDLPPLSERIRLASAYLEELDGSVSGDNGSGAAFEAALALVRGFCLPVSEAQELFDAIFNPKCRDGTTGHSYPWSAEEVSHKLQEAEAKGQKEWRYLLNLRPMIEITPRLDRMNDQAADALRRDHSLYQRGGQLVRVIPTVGATHGVARAPGAPMISPVARATLAERISSVADFKGLSRNAKTWVPKPPPESCVKGVHARQHWDGIRYLEGVVEYPILRRDGSLLAKPGYDSATGLYCALSEEISVPSRPTLDDARSAINELLEVVCDFQFQSPSDRSAWLASVMTPPARYAIDEPAPMFVGDGNAPAVGKTLQSDATAIIVTGRPAVRMTHPREDDEMRKRISAVALAGDVIVLIDNVVGKLGTPSLNAALTGTTWTDRLLGKSQRLPDLPLRITWFATANNVELDSETARRVVPIRLRVEEDHPEERGNFRHPDLKGWVRRGRSRLIANAVNVLVAYTEAGRPSQNLNPFGSYEGWSDLVRSALVWAGEPDPLEGRADFRNESASDERRALAMLMEVMKALLKEQEDGLTAAKLVAEAKKEGGPGSKLREALEELCPYTRNGDVPSTKAVGKALSRNRRKFVDDECIDLADAPASNKSRMWKVRCSSSSIESAVAQAKKQVGSS